jgi:hypothetical protein
MPLLVGPDTIDTVSTDGNCSYPPEPLGTGVQPAVGIFYDSQPLKFSHAALTPTPVVGVKINPAIPAPCQPGIRVLVNKVNKSVFFNRFPALVQGDLCQLAGTDRPLTIPFSYPKLFVANSAK